MNFTIVIMARRHHGSTAKGLATAP